jgi:hypothetical protein
MRIHIRIMMPMIVPSVRIRFRGTGCNRPSRRMFFMLFAVIGIVVIVVTTLAQPSPYHITRVGNSYDLSPALAAQHPIKERLDAQPIGHYHICLADFLEILPGKRVRMRATDIPLNQQLKIDIRHVSHHVLRKDIHGQKRANDVKLAVIRLRSTGQQGARQKYQ